MRIEIWADIICPWCGLGHHMLDQAIARFAHHAEVQLVHHSFQLDPRSPSGTSVPVRTMLTSKMGWTDAQIEAKTAQIERLAASVGLQPYRVLENHVGNTSLAHELAAFATEQGHGNAMWHALYRAYFGEARSVFDVDALLTLASEQKLDVEAAREALTTRRFAQQVRDDAESANRLGARGVPFIVIDGRFAVPGAQSADEVLRILDRAWSTRESAAT